MSRGGWAFLKTLVFTLLLPGSVTVVVPYLLLSRRLEFTLGIATLPGVPVIAVGIAGYLWCAWEFAFKGLGTPAIIDPPRVMVQSGLYRLVRNPMYVNITLILSGEAILFGSLRLAAYALLAWCFCHLFVVLYEEPTLGKKFGGAYKEYCKHVPRWLPKFSRPSWTK